MRTEQGVKIFALLAQHFADAVNKVAKNPKTRKEFEKAAKKGTKSLISLFPTLIEVCGDDIYSIIAIYSDKSVEEIKAQDTGLTLATVREIMNDRGLVDFFALFFENEITSGE